MTVPTPPSLLRAGELLDAAGFVLEDCYGPRFVYSRYQTDGEPVVPYRHNPGCRPFLPVRAKTFRIQSLTEAERSLLPKPEILEKVVQNRRDSHLPTPLDLVTLTAAVLDGERDTAVLERAASLSTILTIPSPLPWGWYSRKGTGGEAPLERLEDLFHIPESEFFLEMAESWLTTSRPDSAPSLLSLLGNTLTTKKTLRLRHPALHILFSYQYDRDMSRQENFSQTETVFLGPLRKLPRKDQLRVLEGWRKSPRSYQQSFENLPGGLCTIAPFRETFEDHPGMLERVQAELRGFQVECTILTKVLVWYSFSDSPRYSPVRRFRRTFEPSCTTAPALVRRPRNPRGEEMSTVFAGEAWILEVRDCGNSRIPPVFFIDQKQFEAARLAGYLTREKPWAELMFLANSRCEYDPSVKRSGYLAPNPLPQRRRWSLRDWFVVQGRNYLSEKALPFKTISPTLGVDSLESLQRFLGDV